MPRNIVRFVKTRPRHRRAEMHAKCLTKGFFATVCGGLSVLSVVLELAGRDQVAHVEASIWAKKKKEAFSGTIT